MRIPATAVVLLIVFSLSTPLRPADLVAKWISTQSGNWDDPANWDIGRVPDNTPTDNFDVIWETLPATVTLRQDVSIRSLTFASGGAIELVRFNLTIDRTLDWQDGSFSSSSQGRVRVNGPASLRGKRPDALILAGSLLFLNGDSDLSSVLNFQQGSSLRIDPAGVLRAHDSASLLNISGGTIYVAGKLQVLSGAQLLPSVQIINAGGALEFAQRSVQFVGQFFDISQQSGTLRVRGGGIKGNVAIFAGKLEGYGHIQSATILADISGRFSLDTLNLGVNSSYTANIGGRLSQEYDRLDVAGDLTIGGTLKVSLTGTFRPSFADVFPIITARTISSQFANVSFGSRIVAEDGLSSFVVDRTVSAGVETVLLRDFIGGPIQLGAAALDYRLPDGAAIASDALINMTDANWAGGSLTVRISEGFDPAKDALLFRSGGRLTIDLSDRQFIPYYDGVPFGIGRLGEDDLLIELNANARNESIEALLQHLYYVNSEFTSEWFKSVADRFPAREISLSLINADGVEGTIAAPVRFPYITALEFQDESHAFPGNESVVDFHYRLSNGQTFTFPQLMPNLDVNCGENTSPMTTGLSFGRIHLLSGSDKNCILTLRLGGFSDSIYVVRGRCLVTLASWISPNVPAALQQMAQQPSSLSLATFYTTQTLLRQNAAGQRLVDLYWQHTEEVVSIISSNTALLQQTVALLSAFQPGLAALLAGNGDDATITPAMIDQLNAVWTNVASAASPQLRQALLVERSKFNNFAAFSNMNLSDWATLLEVPAPTEPFIYISGASRTAEGFLIEINDVPGLELFLLRSENLTNWLPVVNAIQSKDGFTLRLTDPAPAPVQSYYTIEIVE